MNILVNGKIQKLGEHATVHDLIIELQLENKKIAVAIDQNIIPANSYKKNILVENNRVEIVRAVGGG